MSSKAAAIRNSLTAMALGIGAYSATAVHAAPIVFSDGGDATAASILDTVNLFRAALGAPNNGNAPGPLAAGRREINWDGGGPPVINGTAPVTPANAFRNTRGAQFTTPGTGVTQAARTGGTLSLDTINPSYATTFGVFSPNRLFAPIGSNVTDARFFVPGTNGMIPATVRGFGAVFTDVDLIGATTLQFFDINNNLLLAQSAPTGSVADASFSFLGVVFDAGEQIARVRITTGTSELGPNDNPAGGIDLVVMDDFLFAEPRSIPVPGTLALCGLGIAGLALMRRRWS